MNEFFKGWRRKVGVVTLLMACVAMGGWGRSLHIRDIVSFPIWIATRGTFDSNDGVLSWGLRWQIDPDEMATLPKWEVYDATDNEGLLAAYNNTWKWRCGGFGFVDTSWGYGFWIIPYWMLAIPLTLLSAFLLLSKPRPSTPKKTTEPIAEKVA